MRYTLFYVLIGLLCLILSIYILRNIRENFEEDNDEGLDYKDSSATNCKDPGKASNACFWCKGKKHIMTIEFMEKKLEQMAKPYTEILDNNPCAIEIFKDAMYKNTEIKNTLKTIIETILE
jgi:hypothetical protein